MPAGSEGKLLGWYAADVRIALVSFWEGGPLRVPSSAIEQAERNYSVASAWIDPAHN